MLKKHRFSTTISEKHWKLLQKYAEKYETYQKTVEIALENLNHLESIKTHSESIPSHSLEKDMWIRCYSLKSICIVTKDSLQLLLQTADVEMMKKYMDETNILGYLLEYCMIKPLKELSIEEMVNTLTLILKLGNCYDSITCTENNYYYGLLFTHIMGIKGSKIFSYSFEKIFERNDIKCESILSDKSIYMKIYKNY